MTCNGADVIPADMIPVYFRGDLYGEVNEYDARVMLSRKEAWIDRGGTPGRRLILKDEQVAGRVRALSQRDALGGQGSLTYREELYSGSKRDHTAVVTGYCTTLKKLVRHRNGQEEFVPYKERESFRRGRFNPDLLPGPLVVPVVRNQAVPAAWQ